MSFLDFNLNNVPELSALPDGQEYELRILECEVKNSAVKSDGTGGNPMVITRFDVPSEPNSKGITHVMMLPTQADDEKKHNGRLRSLKMFCDAFGIEYGSGISLGEEVVGRTGWAILGIEDSPEYGEQNRVRRFIARH